MWMWRSEHHSTAVTPTGKKAFDKRLSNSEPKLREVFGKLKARHGTVLVVVDQPASIGARPIADAARSMPHTLRSIELEDETVAERVMIVGFEERFPLRISIYPEAGAYLTSNDPLGVVLREGRFPSGYRRPASDRTFSSKACSKNGGSVATVRVVSR